MNAPLANGHVTQALTPARQRPGDREPGDLLASILDTPELALTIPRLQPEILHRIIQRCGLEDCGALVAMATPEQLSAVFDLDLWRSPRPGVDEQFDAERFSVWLEVLLESGDTLAADTVAAVDPGVVISALAQYVHVLDHGALVPPALANHDDRMSAASAADRWCEIGGYRLLANRHDTWDATVALLRGLDAEHRDYFHRVMRACRSLSSAGREVDGLDQLLPEAEQIMFDCAAERERRREQQGYVTPAQAAAFLRMSRTLDRGPDSAPPPGNPIASAYFRAMNWTDEQAPASGVTTIVGLLVDAGVIPDTPPTFLEGPDKPRALLEGSDRRRAVAETPDRHAPRLARIQAHLEFARQHDDAAYARRNQELGYLANVLMAGCSIQARAFTAQEAFEAALSVCSLGLDNWHPHWLAQQGAGPSAIGKDTALPADFLVERDLVGVFQVGWATLHEEVCVFAATRLITVLRALRCDDRTVQAGLRELVKDLAAQCRAGVPWRARQSFDVLGILDMPTWAALLGLVDECPTIHGALAASRSPRVRSVSSTAFEFISENAQIASVHEFMAALPERLLP